MRARLLHLLFLSFILISATRFLEGQNLVVNGQFSYYDECPGPLRHVELTAVSSWRQPTEGTPDYYHPCGHPTTSVPDNLYGSIYPAAGNGYVGMHLYVDDHDYFDDKEYIMGLLSEPMQEGAQYIVQFNAALAQQSRYAIPRVEAHLTTEPIYTKTYGTLFYKELHMEECHSAWVKRFPLPQIRSDSMDWEPGVWETISDTLTAKGGEQYIILGSFTPNQEVGPVLTNPETPYNTAYYYFDNVHVEMTAPPPAHLAENNPQQPQAKRTPPKLTLADSLKPGFTFELKNIFFEFDKAFLKPQSQDALEKLLRFMRGNPHTRIQIEGHTDSVGTHAYNQQLSERRALSVKRYLLQNGINSERLETKGYGKKKPLVSNRTEQGRAKNRRVMIKVLPSE